MLKTFGLGRAPGEPGQAANVEIALQDVRGSDLPFFWVQTSDERALCGFFQRISHARVIAG